jgi:hypothetical protein
LKPFRIKRRSCRSRPRSFELEEARSIAGASEAALIEARNSLMEAQALLAERNTEFEAAQAEHTLLKAKHAQRDMDFDLLLAEQRDTAGLLATARAELQAVRLQAQSDQEGLAGMADQVGALREVVFMPPTVLWNGSRPWRAHVVQQFIGARAQGAM